MKHIDHISEKKPVDQIAKRAGQYTSQQKARKAAGRPKKQKEQDPGYYDESKQYRQPIAAAEQAEGDPGILHISQFCHTGEHRNRLGTGKGDRKDLDQPIDGTTNKHNDQRKEWKAFFHRQHLRKYRILYFYDRKRKIQASTVLL